MTLSFAKILTLLLWFQNLNGTNPTFFLNRAKCYKELSDYKAMHKDALEAVELDDKYVKGYLALGEATIELGKNE